MIKVIHIKLDPVDNWLPSSTDIVIGAQRSQYKTYIVFRRIYKTYTYSIESSVTCLVMQLFLNCLTM